MSNKPRINSKRKGKAGELKLKNELNKYGYETRRSVQYCGTNGDADVVGLKGIHIECKWVEKLNVDLAYEQSVADAKDGDIPIVAYKKSRKPFKVVVSLDDFMKLYQAYEKTLEEST